MAKPKGTASRTAALNAALRRGIFLTVALAVLGAIAGGLVGQRLSTVSVAGATILVNPLDGNPFSTKGSGDDLKNLQTEAQLVPSDDVASLVRESEGSNEPLSQIRSGLSVDVPANTQILEITYSSESSTLALARAQAFATEYLRYRETRAKDLVANQTKRIDEQVAARSKEQTALAKQLTAAPANSTQASVTRVQLEAVSTQINQLRARSAELQSASSNPGQIVTPAAIPSSGILGSWIAFALAGGFASVMLSVAIALLRSRADNHIRHVDDISTAGQVLLGEVSLPDVVASREMLSGHDADSLTLPDAFKNLRVSLLTTEHRRPAVIVITTANSGDEPPLAAAGLALSTATANLRTVVVETMNTKFLPEVEGRDGLAAVLAGERSVDDVAIDVRPQLKVIPGGDPVEFDDLFMAPQMHELIARLRDSADVVFLVTGNVHDPRSKALVDLADSVILEAVQGISSYRDLYRASTDYTLIAEKLLGVVYVAGSKVRSRAGDRSAVDPTPATLWDPPSTDPTEPAENANGPESDAEADTAAAASRSEPNLEPRAATQTEAADVTQRTSDASHETSTSDDLTQPVTPRGR